MRWKLLTTLALAASGLTVSHEEVQAQAPATAGSYTLAQVNGQALPVVTERDTSCTEEVVSGTLTLETDGDWEFEYLERETCGADVEEDPESVDGEYALEGRYVRFSTDTQAFDPDDLDIDELGVGVPGTDELTVTLEDGRTVLLFRR